MHNTNLEPTKATKAQVKYLAYTLQPLVEYKTGMNAALESLDSQTAFGIIASLKRGDDTIALKQLKHLFPDLF